MRSLAFVLGGDAIPTAGRARPAHRRRLAAGAAQRPPRAGAFPPAPRARAGRWLLEFDTGDDDAGAGDAGHGRATRWQGRAHGGAAPARGGPRSRPRSVERAARPEETPGRASRRRRRAAAAPGVLVPLFSLRGTAQLGRAATSPTCPASPAGPREAGLSVVQLLPVNEASARRRQPLRRHQRLRARSGLPGRSTPARTSRPPAAARRCSPELRAGAGGAGGSAAGGLAARAQAQAEAARLAFERFLRDEWQQDSRRAPAAGRVHERAPRLAGRLRPVRRASTSSSSKSWLEWPERLRDAHARRHRRRPRASTTTTCSSGPGCSGSSTCSGASARAEAGPAGRGADGRSALHGGDRTRPTSGRNPSVFRVDLRVGTPPDEASPEGQDWGLPAYDWDHLQRDEFAWIRARAARAGVAVLGLPGRPRHRLLPHLRAQRDRTPEGGFWPADEAAQISLGETILRIMRTSAEVIAEDLGTVPPFLRPSLERLGVPGYRVLRWEKDGDALPRSRRAGPSCRSPPTPPTTPTPPPTGTTRCPARSGWRWPACPGLEAWPTRERFDDEVRDALLAVLYRAPSQLVIVPFQDLFGHREQHQRSRARSPRRNWSYRLPGRHRASSRATAAARSGCPAWRGRPAGLVDAKLDERRGESHGICEAEQERTPGRLRWAVVGLGYFAQAAVLPAFAHARKTCQLVALFSDDPRKRQPAGQEVPRAQRAALRGVRRVPAQRRGGRRLHRRAQPPAQGLHRAGGPGRGARVVRKADGRDRGRVPGDDRRLQAGERQAHDRLPAALRGGQPDRGRPGPPGKAGGAALLLLGLFAAGQGGQRPDHADRAGRRAALTTSASTASTLPAICSGRSRPR